MTDDLKPCPFCGSTELQIGRNPTRPLWEVECYACWGVMTSDTSQSKAEHDWNRRRPEDALRARVEAAEQRAEAAEAEAERLRSAIAETLRLADIYAGVAAHNAEAEPETAGEAWRSAGAATVRELRRALGGAA